MKSVFNTFDVVKFAATAAIHNENQHAKDYIGIVKEVGNSSSFIEWYDCRSKDSTREVTNLTGWIENKVVEVFGDLWHLILGKNEKSIVMPTVNTVVETTVEAVASKPKRKYTRKEGAAKPGPKPKKQVVEKPLANKRVKKAKVVEEAVAESTSATVKVPTPIDKYGNVMNRAWFDNKRLYVIPTGKFKHFATRPMIERSIVDSHKILHKKIDWCLDVAIVGEKPGPSKVEKFLHVGTPMITEEQWLALIGAPGFELDPNVTEKVSRQDKWYDYVKECNK